MSLTFVNRFGRIAKFLFSTVYGAGIRKEGVVLGFFKRMESALFKASSICFEQRLNCVVCII